MNTYAIDSIDIKNCSNTDKKTLGRLKLCNNCAKLPLPSFRSYKNQDQTFCKSCYYKLNLKEKHLLKITDHEEELLGALIFNCKNQECCREFDINSLEEMILHEVKCSIDLKQRLKTCARCSRPYNNFKNHDCIIEFKRDIEFTEQRIEKYIEERLSTHDNLLNGRIKELVDKIEKQEETITNLSKRLNKVEKVNKFLTYSLSDNTNQLIKIKEKTNDDQLLIDKLHRVEKDVHFERLIRIFKNINEDIILNPFLENQVINCSIDLNSLTLGYHNPDFLQFKEGELYKLDNLNALFSQNSTFVCFGERMIDQEEMYRVYEIDLIKGIDIGYLQKELDIINNNPIFNLFRHSRDAVIKKLLDNFESDCSKLPIKVQINKKEFTDNRLTIGNFMRSIKFEKPDSIHFLHSIESKFFNIDNLIKTHIFNLHEYQEALKLPNMVFDKTVTGYKINNEIDNDTKDVLNFYTNPNIEKCYKSERIEKSKRFFLNSLVWDQIKTRMKLTVSNYLKEKGITEYSFGDKDSIIHNYNFTLLNHYQIIKDLISNTNSFINELNDEIRPFWFQISNRGKNLFYELLITEYWLNITK